MNWFCVVGLIALIAILFLGWKLCALAAQIDDELDER